MEEISREDARKSALPSASRIQIAVARRYGALASSGCNLSCGSALDVAAPALGETIVDLGCGRGQDVARAALLVGPEGLAVGVDLSDGMLARAREAVPASLPNVRFVRSDLAALDLEDSFADAVVSNCAINHAPDKAAVFREVHRVLRPGGRVVVSDVVAEEAVPESVRADPAAWAGCYGGAIAEAEYLAAVRAAGLQGLRVVKRSEPYSKGGVVLRSITLRGWKR